MPHMSGFGSRAPDGDLAENIIGGGPIELHINLLQVA